MPLQPQSADEAIEKIQQLADRLRAEIAKEVVGQEDAVESMIVTLLARGHCLLIGVPGLAKTLLVKTLSDALAWEFKRVQFTPDLMPSDILGTEVLESDAATGARRLRFSPGPIFTHVLLADEINRTPPKTQAALLEAMQEAAVTIGGRTLPIEPPFLVVATQNPIEQEGTYPLPEAQLDRFMLSVRLGYPNRSQEEQVAAETLRDRKTAVSAVAEKEEVLSLQHVVRAAPASPHVVSYAVSLTRASRPDDAEATPTARRYAEWGAGPRASQYLVLAAKARALMHGRPAPSTNDVRAVAHAVLDHRVIPNYAATADDVTAEALVDDLLKTVKEPVYR